METIAGTVAPEESHWNGVYSARADDELGWYEKDAAQTLQFLRSIPRSPNETVFLPGAGSSVLVRELLHRGCRVVANDISDAALGRLGAAVTDDEGRLTLLHHDMSKPLPAGLPLSDLWIDRAMLHFLVEPEKIRGYFSNLRGNVLEGGYVLLAEFSEVGAPRCAGLEVHRYTVEEMLEGLGTHFELIRHEEYIHTTPGGLARPYIYALFRRKLREAGGSQ